MVAFQGDVSEHVSAAEQIFGKGAVSEIRSAEDVSTCQGLILPGGESTTIGRLLAQRGVAAAIVEAVGRGVPLLATCAGLVLVSRGVDQGDVVLLGLMDITVNRNAFGSQRESFEACLEVKGFDRPYRAVFIRAPVIDRCGPCVEVLAMFEGRTVAAREGPVLALAFHPELTEDLRFHRLFREMVEAI